MFMHLLKELKIYESKTHLTIKINRSAFIVRPDFGVLLSIIDKLTRQ